MATFSHNVAWREHRQRIGIMATPYLLSIAIPTFNRAHLLDTCLLHICAQLPEFNSSVEVIVSNNNSDDHTDDIVQKYIAQGHTITYLKNSENIGAEKNAVQCFKSARGKYILILGDDDILLDGSLRKIIPLLRNGEYGVVALNAYGYKVDYGRERPRSYAEGITIYADPVQYIKRVNFRITFLSGNIVNKDLVDKLIDPSEFIGTNIPQVNWILTAILRSPVNAYIENYIVAAKQENSGGYKLCQVFGANFNMIFDSFASRGVDLGYFKIINRKLLQNYFPRYILFSRNDPASLNYTKEDCFINLYPVYKNYLSFWLFTVPVIKLPRRAAFFWCLCFVRIPQLIRRIVEIVVIRMRHRVGMDTYRL